MLQRFKVTEVAISIPQTCQRASKWNFVNTMMFNSFYSMEIEACPHQGLFVMDGNGRPTENQVLLVYCSSQKSDGASE